MGLQQFERRLERMVEGVFARAFRGGLQPVEIGRRLTREMDLRRTIAPKGTLAPNAFVVVLSPADRARFASIEDELIEELISVAEDHGQIERYSFLGPVTVTMETDEDLSPGMVLVSGEMLRGDDHDHYEDHAGYDHRDDHAGYEAREPQGRTARAGRARLRLPDGQTVELGRDTVTVGRLPECVVVLADPNVSRYHAEVRPAGGGGYEVIDMGSTNGTKVNGMPLAGPRQLRPGDRITMGATTIGFERD